MPLITLSQTRKERRKLERKKRKRQGAAQNHHNEDNHENAAPPTKQLSDEDEAPSPKVRKSKKSKKSKSARSKSDGPYAHLDPEIAESIQRDDAEIEALASKLGLGKGKSSKDKLNKEYSRLEGYGDDFGEFLDDLDDMVHRVSGGSGGGAKTYLQDDLSVSDEGSDEEENLENEHRSQKDKIYDGMDNEMADAMRHDDEEIADLGRKLGLRKKKEKSKLYTEYKLEGYGDDFGDFLDGLDDMVARVKDNGTTKEYERKVSRGGHEAEHVSDASSEASEELVPMKDPAFDDMEEDDSVLEDLEREEDASESDIGEEDADPRGTTGSGASSGETSSEDEDGSEKESAPEELDHDISDTYKPSKGEDIYGKKIDSEDQEGLTPTKYVPPHLRRKVTDGIQNEEKLRLIQRGLNNALNRLSEDTLVSVAQQVAQLYSSHPTQMVHEVLWKNIKDACVLTPVLMKGMIPVYLACVVGAHIQTGDTVQIVEYILEVVTTELWSELDKFRQMSPSQSEGNALPPEVISKHICNRMLILCYLYNYNVVHCSFMYEFIRHLIQKFTEVDIECLLLLLSHSGRSLRSDDPLALKDIVLLVEKTNAEAGRKESSSRAEYMVSAITDLKNNKRRKLDTAYGETTTKLRKFLGQIKSAAAKSNSSKTTSESSLKISLKDILRAETKGRWWKVGASWVGNQYRYNGDTTEQGAGGNSDEDSFANEESPMESEENAALLKLASKFRMNTDRKRAIFCIVMGSEDCEDAFEKLCRSSMLQNRSERDTCRVLFECCLNEKTYNKFYGHLAARMCEFQPQCKFSLQLAFWDMFKQFEGMDARKAANLATFLFHLAVNHHILRLMTVLKAMDISEGDMEDSALIFLTVLLSSILDHFDDIAPIKAIFAARQPQGHEDPSRYEQEEGARASLLVFFMETLQASPKNAKGSQFRKNFKAAVKALDTDGFESML